MRSVEGGDLVELERVVGAERDTEALAEEAPDRAVPKLDEERVVGHLGAPAQLIPLYFISWEDKDISVERFSE